MQIIIQKEGKKYKYICVLNRNILLLSNIGQVKQWIRDIQFVINGFSLHGDDDKINSMKNDIVSKDCKLLNNKKEIMITTSLLEEITKIMLMNTMKFFLVE